MDIQKSFEISRLMQNALLAQTQATERDSRRLVPLPVIVGFATGAALAIGGMLVGFLTH